jgi:hypothetical protein
VSDTHECPVDGCDVQVGLDHLMCREHWFLVPKVLRHQVWRAWRGWQSGRNSGSDYIKARDEAIAAADDAAKQESLL